ncbi:MAG: hypothetical protein ISR96_00975 [Nitrospira sp.]|nr:hypothetical protein [bacterium]MBL7048086.1 hypothetical protein [Nitrospira sp.]
MNTGIMYSGEIAQEVTLDGGADIISVIRFGYRVMSIEPAVEGRVRFYKNDGYNGSPGGLLYDSGEFMISGDFFEPLYYSLNIPLMRVPETFIWSISTSGDLMIAQTSSPEAGYMNSSLWIKDDNWEKSTLYDGALQLQIAVDSFTVAPEPGGVMLMFSGMFVIAGFRSARYLLKTRKNAGVSLIGQQYFQ